MRLAPRTLAGLAGLAMTLSGAAWAVPCADPGSGVFTDAGFTTPAYTTCADQTDFAGAGQNPTAAILNAGAFAGQTSWVELAEHTATSNTDKTATVTGFTVEGMGGTALGDDGSETGTWSFAANLWDVADELAIGLKDGGTQPDGDRWSVYLLADLVSSGYYVYGIGLNSGQLAALSNARLFGVLGVPVSEPAVLGLLGAGLIVLGVSRRRKGGKG